MVTVLCKKEGEIYTDDCGIRSEIEWIGTEGVYDKEKTRMTVTKRGYKIFKQQMEQEKVSQILIQNLQLQEAYDKWVDKVLEIKKRCEIKIKSKKENRSIRQLMRIKRRDKWTTGELRNIRLILLNTHIQSNKQRGKIERIERTVEELRSAGGGMKEEAFWELRRRMKGKTQEKNQG